MASPYNLLQVITGVKGKAKIKNCNIENYAKLYIPRKKQIDPELGNVKDYGLIATIDVELYKRDERRCPFCHRKCPGYDDNSGTVSTWRSSDLNGVIVELRCHLNRIECPEHGVVVEGVPWARHGSRFTTGFENETTLLAINTSSKFTSNYLRLDWKTVGRIVNRVFNELEPDPTTRLSNLEEIGIDETSFRKGQKYITVVMNLKTNTVVWTHEGHGKEVIDIFFKLLSDEQRNRIKYVTGDGANWITSAVKEWVPNAVRCVDLFHVVQWAIDALDGVRTNIWHSYVSEAKSFKKKAGNDKTSRNYAKYSEKAEQSQELADTVKGTKYALGKNPENLTDYQHQKLIYVSNTHPDLYRAYCLKEKLRLLLTYTNMDKAKEDFKAWIKEAKESGLEPMAKLANKIENNLTYILNSMESKHSNAKLEAINNKIKLIIRKAYGFRNLDNMMSWIMLVCSDLTIPLPNRGKNAVLRAG